MTRDDIIRMAQESGATQSTHPEKWDVWNFQDPAIERFAALVAKAEREACAELARKTICDTHIPTGINIYGSRAAKAIRARGTK